ncbi:response regulator [Lederbergia sp. NSJ-179]|uniref:response regulator n=1 Tax=Lederbergia sp. NSJ-179 TaxID=2931402 RepID=UPI001FD62F03|nr:response regulator [Lederbergia sp. NSJ-179]MCJ7842320.1 response regulator [Lederbergia sp. NSJ-179]
MKLLIVDDERRILEYLLNVMEWEKYGFNEVKGLSSSKEALLLINNGYEPDVLITDIKMPEVTGLDLVQAMNRNTKVIIISGYSDFEFAQKAIRFGVKDYLLKPIFQDELKTTISKVINEISIEKMVEDINLIDFYLHILNGKEANVFEFNYIFNKIIESNFIASFVLFDMKSICNFTWNNRVFGFVKSEIDELPKSKNANRKIIIEKLYDTKINDMPSETKLKSLIQNKNWNLLIEELKKAENNMSQDMVINKLEILLYLNETLPKMFTHCDVGSVLNLVNDDNLLKFLYLNLDHNIETISNNEEAILFVQDYIQRNLSSPLSLEMIADKVYLHPVYLSKIYKEGTGENLSSYILNKRLEKMKELLEKTDLKIKTITEMIGYKKPQNVNELFKKKYKVTPSQYRKNMKNRNFSSF